MNDTKASLLHKWTATAKETSSISSNPQTTIARLHQPEGKLFRLHSSATYLVATVWIIIAMGANDVYGRSYQIASVRYAAK
jgi:hypothetical protein